MKTKDFKINRITKDISTVVVLEDKTEFIMCGKIIDGILRSSIAPVFHQDDEFHNLSEEIQNEIQDAAKNEFDRNYMKY